MKKIMILTAVTLAVSMFAMQPDLHAQEEEQDRGEAVFAPADTLGSIALRRCDQRTSSGLGYQILENGKGARPTDADKVTVGYAGYFLTNGARFDAGRPVTFPVTGVIPGFSEGVKLMNRGSTYRLCIPSQLGYGARGAGGAIPPNSHLIFIVEMIDF